MITYRYPSLAPPTRQNPRFSLCAGASYQAPGRAPLRPRMRSRAPVLWRLSHMPDERKLHTRISMHLTVCRQCRGARQFSFFVPVGACLANICSCSACPCAGSNTQNCQLWSPRRPAACNGTCSLCRSAAVRLGLSGAGPLLNRRFGPWMAANLRSSRPMYRIMCPSHARLHARS
jgi:hypothetical protein